MAAQKPRMKHVPQRSCVVCRQKSDKRLLTRLVYSPDTGIIVDPTGKQPGRGAYLCRQVTCWDKAIQTSLLNQAFKTSVPAAVKTMLAAHRPAESESPETTELIDQL
jgi:uncharacterized protein